MKALRLFFALAIAVGSPAVVCASDFQVPPAPTYYVTDSISALAPQTRSKLETGLRDYAKATGNQVVVYIGNSTQGVPLEEWTAQAAHAWKIGHAKKDNGAVLFLFIKDRRVRIEVGYGLESVLTDADSKRIIDESIVPQMKNGNVNAAVAGGISGILHQISPDYKAPEIAAPPEPNDDNKLDLKTILLVIGALGLFILFWLAGSSGGGDYRSDRGDGHGSGDGGGGDFSSGGGDFGGGGASGSW